MFSFLKSITSKVAKLISK